MSRAVQKISKAYLAETSRLSTQQILNFLEEYRILYYGALAGSRPKSPSRLISLKVPENLLDAFRTKAQAHGTAYQTQIKKLMESWLLEK